VTARKARSALLSASKDTPDAYDSCRCSHQPSQSHNEKGQHSVLAFENEMLSKCYFAQVSLTIFRAVTLRSPYSSFPDAFSIWPSFFSSLFSSAFDSRWADPVTVT